MDILSLTTTEAIRALLGVALETAELEDQVFDDLEISDGIELDLLSWLPASQPIATILSSGSPVAKKALRACAKYIGALLFLPALVTATAKQQKDGQDEFQRQDRDWRLLREQLEAGLAKYKTQLLSEVSPGTATTVSWFGRARPDFDPVTG